MKLLFFIPSLRYSGSASEVRTLAGALNRSADVHIACLRGGGPWADELSQLGVSVHFLGGNHTFDVRPLWRLLRLLRDLQPETIHVWGLPQLRSLALIGRSFLERSWLSRLSSHRRIKGLDRWLIHRSRGLIARGAWEAENLQAAAPGVPVELLSRALAPQAIAEPAGASRAADLRLIRVGRLERHQGQRDALWTMDILSHLMPELRLELVGDGSLAEELEDLAGKVYQPYRTHLHGSVNDLNPFLQPSHVAWITARPGHGLNAALEALASGCPVVAYDQPGLREWIVPGENGVLLPHGNMMTLARQTYALLQDAARRGALSRAGRRTAERHVVNDAWLERCRKIYAA